jgi:hypothetical protein
MPKIHRYKTRLCHPVVEKQKVFVEIHPKKASSNQKTVFLIVILTVNILMLTNACYAA